MAQPTMEDVAEAAGVSRSLVSLVMRNSPNVSEQRRAAVLKAVADLGYRPNVLARNLASSKTMTLGVVVNDLHNPFFAEVIDGIQHVVDDRHYQVLINTGRGSSGGETGAIESLLRLRVDGLILIGMVLPDADLTAAAASTPTVLVSRAMNSSVLDTVNNDDRLGAELAMRHLLDLGHTRIAHIGGGEGAGARARANEYERVMIDHDLADHVRSVAGDYTETSGAEAAAELFTTDVTPTAIFAANDQMALGTLDYLDQLGVRVPSDVSLVGYDNTAVAALGHVSLTTINQPRERMGRSAAELLLERVAGDREQAVHHVVAPSLVTRSTTANLCR